MGFCDGLLLGVDADSVRLLLMQHNAGPHGTSRQHATLPPGGRLTLGKLEPEAALFAKGAVEAYAGGLLQVQPLAPAAMPAGRVNRQARVEGVAAATDG